MRMPGSKHRGMVGVRSSKGEPESVERAWPGRPERWVTARRGQGLLGPRLGHRLDDSIKRGVQCIVGLLPVHECKM